MLRIARQPPSAALLTLHICVVQRKIVLWAAQLRRRRWHHRGARPRTQQRSHRRAIQRVLDVDCIQHPADTNAHYPVRQSIRCISTSAIGSSLALRPTPTGLLPRIDRREERVNQGARRHLLIWLYVANTGI